MVSAFSIKVIVAYLAFLVGVGSFGGQLHYNTYNAPCGCFLVVSTLLAFPKVADIDQFISYSFPFIVILFQVPLLLFLFIVARRKKREEGQTLIPRGTKLHRFYRMMVWGGAISFAGCILTILLGDMLSDKSPAAGIATAIAYIIFMVIALLASYGEMQALNHGKQRLGRPKQQGNFRQ